MLFKEISYLELCQTFYSAEWNHMGNFGRGYYEKELHVIIFNLGQWFRRRCYSKKKSYLELLQPSCSVELKEYAYKRPCNC